MTRIRYTKHDNFICSESFVINRNLVVIIVINTVTSELNIKCGLTGESVFRENSTSIVSAKYRARQKLKELGMRFNQEFRK